MRGGGRGGLDLGCAVPGVGKSSGPWGLAALWLGNSMSGGAWRATIHGFQKSRAQLSE